MDDKTSLTFTERPQPRPGLKGVAPYSLPASSLASTPHSTLRTSLAKPRKERQLCCDTCHRRVPISSVLSTSPSGILSKLGWGRRLKLAPPPLPGGPCALSCVHTREGSSVSSEPIKIPSNILLWLLSSRGKQQLAAAKLNGAPELGLEASMLHLHTTALLRTLA